MKQHSVTLIALLLFIISACAVATDPERVTWANSKSLKTLTCGLAADCAAYEACVSGGTVQCVNGHCAGINNDTVDFSCLVAVFETGDVPAGTSCGPVNAPPEQVAQAADRSYCNFFATAQPGDDEFRPWMQCVANLSGATVQVVGLSVYCAKSGLFVPVGGTDAGKAPVTWSGLYSRSPWFVPSNKFAEATALGNNSFAVPTNPYVLHFGTAASSVGCVEGVVTATISTTGDAQCQIGLDYYTGNSWTREAAVSDWRSCTNGVISLETPSSTHLVCTGSFGQVCVPSVEVCNGKDDNCDGQIDEGGVCTPANPCPASGFRLTADASLLASCANGLQIVTWGANGNEIASSPGQPLTVSQQWNGYAYVTTKCNGLYKSDWPQFQTAQTGFSEICLLGQDITASTQICWDKYSHIWRPTVPMSLGSVGTCPP